jgi:hypothetical protein
MVTTRSPKVPVARVLKEANRRYRHEHRERVSAAHVRSNDGVQHAHEIFQKRPGKLLDLLRFRLVGGGSVMATFHEGMIRYVAKNLEHESAEVEYDAGLGKRVAPTIPAAQPQPMEFDDEEDSEKTRAGKENCAARPGRSTQAPVSAGSDVAGQQAEDAKKKRARSRSGRPLDFDSGLYKLLKKQGRVDDVMLMLHIETTSDPDVIDALQLSAFSTYQREHPEPLGTTTVQSYWYGKTTRFILFDSDPVAIEDLIEAWTSLGGTASVHCRKGRIFQLARLSLREGATHRQSLDARLSRVAPSRTRLSWDRRTRVQDEAVRHEPRK